MQTEKLQAIFKYLGIIGAVCLLIAFVGLIVSLYKFVEKPEANPYTAIPENNAMLFSVKDMKTLDTFVHEIAITYDDGFLNKLATPIINYMKMLQKEKDMLHYMEHNKIFISFQNNGRQTLNTILICPIVKKYQKKFEKYWQHQFSIVNTYKNIPIVQIAEHTQTYYAIYYKGVFVLTDHSQTIRKVINEWGKKSKSQSALETVHDDFAVLIDNENFISYYHQGKRSLVDEIEKSYWLKAFDYMYGSITMKNSVLCLNIKAHLKNNNMFELATNNMDIAQMVDGQTYKMFYLGQQFFHLFEPDLWDRKVDDILFSQLTPKEILCFANQDATNVTRNYLMLTIKDVDKGYDFLLSATETTMQRENMETMDYDTFYCGNTMIGRVNLPNFVYQRWRFGKELPHLKAFAWLNDRVIFSDKDSNLIAYISNVNKHAENNEYEQTSSFFVKQTQMINFVRTKQNNGNLLIKRYQLQQFDEQNCLFYMIVKNNQ